MTVIDDSFNASPLSMQLGLDTLAECAPVRSPRRRVALLGSMAELGVESARYHTEVGAYARPRADLIVGVGAAARDYEPHRWFAVQLGREWVAESARDCDARAFLCQ